MTVLVVEDELLMQDALVDALIEKGFAVHVAQTGADAMRQLAQDAPRYKAAIIDIRLADSIPGWQVSRFARELIQDLPILYISGRDAVDWSEMAVSNSVMLQKPIDIHALLDALDNLLVQRRAALATLPDDYSRETTVADLSDDTLVRYFSLLSDTRMISNVPALPLLEAEIRRRGLPIGKNQ